MSKTSMKNRDIMALVGAGLLGIDYSDADGGQAYKVYRFLRDVRNAARDIEEQRGELVRRHVSEEELRGAQAYEAARRDKREPEMSEEEYRAVIAKLSEAGGEVEALMDDSTEMDVRPIPSDDYFRLKKANAGILKFFADELLEGVLWNDREGKDGPGAE